MKLTKYIWKSCAGIMPRCTKVMGNRAATKNALRCMLTMALMVLASVHTAPTQAINTTTVQGTVYLANGQPGAGTLVVSWPSFTTASGQMVAADSMNVPIAPDGFVSVSLAPNLGATPGGEYYTAVYYMSDGTVSTQYWVIPAAAQASLAQVQAQVMPAAQAAQSVNKAYVDQAVAGLTNGQLTATGGTLSGPLYLSGDPTQAFQAADKHYVDSQVATALPMSGGTLSGPLSATQIGAAYQVDQFAGVDFGAKLQACVNAVSASNGGTCDARNFSGTVQMATSLTISKGNVAILLPCATIATANQMIVTAGTRNVTLHGCAMRGGSAASGSTGGTAIAYSGGAAAIAVGDPTYATDTPGFHMDNVVINTTSSTSASAQGLAAYRTQEMDLEDMYFLGNANQTGMTLDGTGNYTGGTFRGDQFSGFQTAVKAIGHQMPNAATTDWMNASTFLRVHIDCPTSNGSPVSGTYGINLQQGDGNTFTGGDIEGCATALHLGANAQNNTFVGLRNENSTNQVVADAGSSYNSWMTGGTMFTGKLTDNGTRNSFLDSFHRSFNGLNGDWYGSQQDATVVNHYRLGIGAGNERGLQDRYQTDAGYRWTMGLSDATAGEQFYQVLDELNNVYRVSIGQYNNAQTSTNNQTVINSAGTGAVVLNGSNGAGTGGVIVGSGGAAENTVATISNAGNAQFTGTLQVGATSQSTGTMTVRNNADAEVDYYLWPGLTSSQKGSFTYKDWNGNSQWYLVKDATNNWSLNSATGGLDSFKAYQSTNSGDTYINTSNAAGHIRLNYEGGSGAETDIYSGSSTSLDAAFQGPTSIKLPGLAAGTGHFCLQVDSSGYLSNTGVGCGSSNSGAVSAGNSGQIAYYMANGTTVGGMNSVPLSAGGTGATNASAALSNLGGVAQSGGSMSGPLTATAFNGPLTGNVTGTASGNLLPANNLSDVASASAAVSNLLPGVAGDGNHGITVQGNLTAAGGTMSGPLTATAFNGPVNGDVITAASPEADIRAYGAVIDGATPINTALASAQAVCPLYSIGQADGASCDILIPGGGAGAFLGPTSTPIAAQSGRTKIQGWLQLSSTLVLSAATIEGDCGGGGQSFVNTGCAAVIGGPNVSGTLGTSTTADTASSVTPTFTNGSLANLPVGSAITISDNAICTASVNLTFSSFSSAVNYYTATCAGRTDIPSEAIINVTGCSNPAFNTTSNGASVYSVDWSNNGTNNSIITWLGATGTAGSATGCTITGLNADTLESVRITGSNGTSCAAGSICFTPSYSHSSSAQWGEVAVMNPYNDFDHADLDGISIANCMGACFWGEGATGIHLDGDSFVPAYVNGGGSASSVSVELTSTAYQSASISNTHIATQINFGSGCGTNNTCYPTAFPFALLCDGLPSNAVGYGNGNGCNSLVISNSVIDGGIYTKGNPNGTGDGAGIPNMNNVTTERSNSCGIVMDPRYGTYYTSALLNGFGISDPSGGGYSGDGSLAYLCATDNSTNFNLNTISLLSPQSPYPMAATNRYWSGSTTGDNIGAIAYSQSGPPGSVQNGATTLTELEGIGANLGPSVVPYATLATSSIISACPSNYTCTATTGPDGTTTYATEVDDASGNYPGAQIGSTSVATYPGDWVLYGGWVAPGANQTKTSSVNGDNLPFYFVTHGTDTFVSSGGATSSGSSFGLNFTSGLDWHTQIVLDTIQAGESTPHSVTFSVFSGGNAGQGIKYACPFWTIIPGPNNPGWAAAGSPTLADVERARKDLYHGCTPSNYNNPGVPATQLAISAGGYQVNGAPFATGNLADWTNIGAANGSVPVWNSTTNKWTPGTLPGAVNSINGNSGAFTFTGAGVSCAGTTCTVAGSSGTGTVQAGNEYSPAFYNQSGSNATVGGVTPFTGLGYWQTNAPPAAATAAQIVGAIGATAVANATNAASATTATNFSGSLTGDVTGTQSATTVAKVNGGAVPASAALVGTNASSQAVAATAHNESVPRTCTTANTSNAYTCSTTPSFTPAAGDTISIAFNAANSGAATLAVNGATAAAIKKLGNSSNLSANDVLAGHWIGATYDGTSWQLEGQLGNANATQVNGAAVPASAAVLGTNSSSQAVAATAAQIVGVIGATAVSNATTAVSFSGSLVGDVTGTQGATTVAKVNGAVVPASAKVLSSNSSSQLTSAATTGSGNVVLATSPALTTPTLGVASATSVTTTASSTFGGSANLFNNAAAATNLVEIQAGSGAAQTETIQWQNYSGTAEWQHSVDTSYTFHIKDAVNSLDRMTIYQGAGNTNVNAGNGAYAVCLNCAANSGTGGLLVQNGAASPSTVLTVTGSGNTTASGFVSGKSFMGSGTMTLAAGAAAGSSPTIACATSHVCDGVSGTVTLTTGTGPATGTLATLTFPSSHTNYANCMVAVQSGTAVLTTNTWTETASAITVTANSALTASTAYTVRYWCGGN